MFITGMRLNANNKSADRFDLEEVGQNHGKVSSSKQFFKWCNYSVLENDSGMLNVPYYLYLTNHTKRMMCFARDFWDFKIS